MQEKTEYLVFDQVYKEYFPKIYHYVYYRILHKEISEDITGDIFLKVMLNLKHFDRTKASLNTWIFRIAQRTLIDYYRVRKVHVNLDSQSHILFVSFGEQYRQNTEDTYKELYYTLSRLTRRQQIVLILKYFYGMTNRRISTVTGIPPSTVGTIHQRALASIRKSADLELLESCMVW